MKTILAFGILVIIFGGLIVLLCLVMGWKGMAILASAIFLACAMTWAITQLGEDGWLP